MPATSEKAVREIVRERSQGLCERCGYGGGQTLHHRLKRSHLPRNDQWQVWNCAMLCGDGVRGCHGWVEHFPNDAAGEGWHVRPWEDPAEKKVLYQGRWAFLGKFGSVDYETFPSFGGRDCTPVSGV